MDLFPPERIRWGAWRHTQAISGSGRVRGGFLEESGVNAARMMTQMISSFRSLEADQKSIQTIDETLSESAGSVGAIS